VVGVDLAKVVTEMVSFDMASTSTIVTPSSKCITSDDAVIRGVVAERIATGIVTSTRVLVESFTRSL
jgi:hypothetical protein